MSLAVNGCSEFRKVDKDYAALESDDLPQINLYPLDLIEFRTRQDEELARKHVFVSVSEEFLRRKV